MICTPKSGHRNLPPSIVSFVTLYLLTKEQYENYIFKRTILREATDTSCKREAVQEPKLTNSTINLLSPLDNTGFAIVWYVVYSLSISTLYNG